MGSMKIVADENITFARQAFAALGHVDVLPAGKITPDLVRDADALFIRSVTKVGEGLLRGSRVRFVGTATIGEDHVDRAYLDAHGIGFASAPGCNANSVAEYVIAAILSLARHHGWTLAGKTLGIVGVGRVGSRVRELAQVLGMNCLFCDPPRARAEGGAGFVQLPELLSASDIVTLHVPLIRQGQDKTAAMADESFFSGMKRGAAFINTARGAVMREAALLAALASGRVGHAVLDVWENEPSISRDTLKTVSIATPHIAGYSFDGKVKGTEMVLEAACAFLGRPCEWTPDYLMPQLEVAHVALDARGRSAEAVLEELVGCVYSVDADDARLRAVLLSQGQEMGAYFTGLRKNYPTRREFHHTRVHLRGGSDGLRQMVEGLGFRVA